MNYTNGLKKRIKMYLNCQQQFLLKNIINQKKKINSIFTIGWIGNGDNHMKNLKILKPIFLKLIEKNIKFRFKLIGSANNLKLLSFFNSIKNLNFIYKNHIKWENINSSISELKTFDIGIKGSDKRSKNPWQMCF